MYPERRHRATQRGGLHLLELSVALDKFLCAAAGEADREFAVFIVPFDADNGAHAEIGMADFLAQQGIAVGATLCGRASECAGTAGASRTRGRRGRNAPHAAEKLFWRVRIFWIGLVTPGLPDFGH